MEKLILTTAVLFSVISFANEKKEIVKHMKTTENSINKTKQYKIIKKGSAYFCVMKTYVRGGVSFMVGVNCTTGKIMVI